VLSCFPVSVTRGDKAIQSTKPLQVAHSGIDGMVPNGHLFTPFHRSGCATSTFNKLQVYAAEVIILIPTVSRRHRFCCHCRLSHHVIMTDILGFAYHHLLDDNGMYASMTHAHDHEYLEHACPCPLVCQPFTSCIAGGRTPWTLIMPLMEAGLTDRSSHP